jgi:hypothetical protein
VDTESFVAGQKVVGGPDRLGDDHDPAVPVDQCGLLPEPVVDDLVCDEPGVGESRFEPLDRRVKRRRHTLEERREPHGDVVTVCDRRAVASVSVEQHHDTPDCPEPREEVVDPLHVDRVHNPDVAVGHERVAGTLHLLVRDGHPADTAVEAIDRRQTV